MSLIDSLPEVRGLLVANVPLKKYTWLRVGGEAEVLFVPKDEADLAHFLSSTSENISMTVLGAASNLLVGDSGVKGVVIKLGGGFSTVSIEGSFVRAGAAALDNKVAKKSSLIRYIRFGILCRHTRNGRRSIKNECRLLW